MSSRITFSMNIRSDKKMFIAENRSLLQGVLLKNVPSVNIAILRGIKMKRAKV